MRADAATLKRHLHCLVGEIGERDVFRPPALAAAAAYIEATWQRQGYAERRQSYDVMGVLCANIEVTRPGTGPDGGAALKLTFSPDRSFGAAFPARRVL